MARTYSIQKLGLGTKAIDFNLLGVDGRYYTLKDFKKDLLLIIFMANHCPYVRARMNDINELYERFKDRVDIVGINSNDPKYEGEGYENMKLFAKEFNIKFPYLFDEKQEVAKAYGAVCTPDPFLFDKDRRLVYHGRINDAMSPDAKPTINIMAINIEKILKGERIDKWFDPSVGCSIKWIQ
jgi:peroxiredoxin